MSIQDFLSYLQSLDISINVDNGRLICDAPKGILTASLQAEIKQRKNEIIDFLQRKPLLEIEPILPQTRPEILPLSFAQQRLWFLEQLSPGLSTYNVPISFRITGKLKIDILQQSLNEIIYRHEILRTTFHEIGEKSTQVIAPSSSVQLAMRDFTDLPTAERETRIQQHLQAEAKRPFDLTKGPLLRVSIVRLGNADHVLSIVLHHIISDGWSTGIFLRELSTLYAAHDAGCPSPLPGLPIQYADFSIWQRKALSGPLLEQQLAYWTKHLENTTAILELPADHPRPSTQSYKGANYEVQISPQFIEALRSFAQHEGSTLFMVLLAAFQVLLYRYTGQPDFVIASPIANRHYEEIERLIGFFVNTLPLRAQLEGDLSFINLLKNVRETCLEAYANQDLPFEKIVDELQLPRDLSRNALCQVSFVLQNTSGYSLNLPGAEVKEISVSTDTSKFDLSLVVNTVNLNTSVAVEFNTDLFDPGTIERLVGHYQHLLESILADPTQKIATLSLLTEAEYHQLLVEWNDTSVKYARNKCIHELFEEQAKRTPENIAVVFRNEQLTYRELNEQADKLACYLRELGVGPDVLVGICLERSLEMVVGLYGILKAGGAYVPIDPGYPTERVAYMLQNSQANILLSQYAIKDKLPAFDGHIIYLDTNWEQAAHINHPASETNVIKPSFSNLAYVIYTSGSTGQAKGAMLTHGSISNHMNWMQADYPLSQDDAVLQKTPFSFDGSVWEFYATLLVGGRLVMAEPGGQMDPAYLVQAIKEYEVTVLQSVPTLLDLLLREPDFASCLSLKRVFCGGEALEPRLVKQFIKLLPEVELVNLYGPTEATINSVVWRCPKGTNIAPTTSTIPIGRPIANMQAYILDSALQPVPIGVKGELHVGGQGVGRGYLFKPELTKEKFIPNPFAIGLIYKTGDWCRYLPDGNIEFLGRMDYQVKIRGFRIELGEIEAVLEQYAGIHKAVVVARTEPTGQKRLVAYFTVKGDVIIDADKIVSSIRNHLKQYLPVYMVPHAFVLLEQLPLTPNGKIDRKALPEPDNATTVAASAEFIPPATPTEQVLADIWADLLGVQQVGRHDNFFELGGDSIISLQFISRAQSKGLYLTPRQVFEAQTIEALAQLAQSSNFFQAEQGLVFGQVPLTPVQHRFFEHHTANPHHYNQSTVISPSQRIDEKLLSQAVDYLTKHHDALRMRFQLTQDGWKQEYAQSQALNNLIIQVDLTALAPAEQQNAIQRINTELQAGLNIQTGPLLRIALIDFEPEQPQELLIIIHHLIIDFVSWEIFISDLWTVYGQLAQQQTPQLPAKSGSYKAWAEWLTEYAYHEELLAELPYWLKIDQQLVQHLPIDKSAPKCLNKDSGKVEVALSGAETEALLRDVPGVYHTQINDILLTALVQAFSEWTGQSTLLIHLEGHGRETEKLDISRTMGWFTSIFPVCLRLDIKEPGKAIKSIKEQLRSIPQKGAGYGVLRYLNSETSSQLAKLPQAEVCFNYGGQFKTMTMKSYGGEVDEAEQLAYLFNINGAVDNDQLSISWTYDRNTYEHETVERLANRFIFALQNLIAHCREPQAGGYTPSDFPLSALSQEKLDRLIGQGTNITDIYPLSPFQSVILSQSLSAPNSGAYITQTGFQITGDFNVHRFKQAWQRALDRHTILRSSFAWQDLPKPLQIVHTHVALPWEEQDWRNLPDFEQVDRLEKLRRDDLQKGFELTQPHLTKCTLIRLEEKRYQFIWQCHHLLMDGWSSRLVLQDVMEYYENPVSDHKSAKPYREYLAWIDKQNPESSKQFWREYMDGFTSANPLLDQKLVPYFPSGHFAEESLLLASELFSALQALAQQYHLTINTLCQGAWALVLHQYCNQRDIVFGVTVSGRSASLVDIESRVGLFINTLPLRIKVHPDLSWMQWLQSIMQEQVLLEQFSYTSPNLPTPCSKNSTTEPLFQSTFRFQNYPFKDVKTEPQNPFKIDNYLSIDWWYYPLNVIVVPDSRLQLYISYDSKAFKSAIIQEILTKFKGVLSNFVKETPDSKLSSLLPG